MPPSKDIRLIEDELSRQLSYAKRRNGLIKKALELYMVCNVDSLFISFSPCGRLSYFCGEKRIEEILEKFIALPENIRKVHFTEDEFEELIGILDELKEGTEEVLREDRTVQELQKQIDKVKAELAEKRSEIRSKYEPSPDSNVTAEEAENAEVNLEAALARVQDRLRELVEIQGGQQFLTCSKVGSENLPSDPSTKTNQTEPEEHSDNHQTEVASQVDSAESSQVVSSPERPEFPNLLLPADAPATPSPPRESEKNINTYVFETLLQHVHDHLLNKSKKNQSAEVIQPSDEVETPDTFILPAADSPPAYHIQPQVELGESHNTNLCTCPNAVRIMRARRRIEYQNRIARTFGANENPPPPWHRPPTNEIYSATYEMMGLPIDPHLRLLQRLTKTEKEKNRNKEQ